MSLDCSTRNVPLRSPPQARAGPRSVAGRHRARDEQHSPELVRGEQRSRLGRRVVDTSESQRLRYRGKHIPGGLKGRAVFAFTWSPAWPLSDERSESDMPGSDREHREGFLPLNANSNPTRNRERVEGFLRPNSDTTNSSTKTTEADR